jgi:hypothetical protein
MADTQFQAWNHFVPRLYLKRFSCSPGLIWHYPLLVSHPSVPEWNRLAISKAAAQENLYTVAEESGESDEIERWFSKEFDNPAEEAIERAVTGATLTREHWRRLARFFGAQYARTPANYIKSQERWKSDLSASMEAALEDVRQELSRAKEQGLKVEWGVGNETNKMFPLRSTIAPSDEPGMAELCVRVSAGRKLWLWGLKHTLRPGGILEILGQHRWTILDAPDGCSWFTSDNPAVQMGLGNDATRNLGGGWGALGTVLMLPLSPRHLLYAEIGTRPPEKYTVVPVSKFEEIRRVIANNAARSIFASTRDNTVQQIRTRHVDASAFDSEKQQWRDWHEHHSDAERFIDLE